MPSEVIVVLCTVPDDAVAERLAKGLVESKLAACVNIVSGVRSIYEWKGELEDDSELLLVIKSQRAHFEALESWVVEHHPYDVPEVIALEVSCGSKPYLDWVIG